MVVLRKKITNFSNKNKFFKRRLATNTFVFLVIALFTGVVFASSDGLLELYGTTKVLPSALPDHLFEPYLLDYVDSTPMLPPNEGTPIHEPPHEEEDTTVVFPDTENEYEPDEEIYPENEEKEDGNDEDYILDYDLE